MAWLEFKFELGNLVKVLTRIADALDRAYPVRKPTIVKPAQPEDLIQFDPEEQWLREQEEEERGEWKELPPQPK